MKEKAHEQRAAVSHQKVSTVLAFNISFAVFQD